MGEWLQCHVEDIAHPSRNSLVGGPFGSNLVSSDYTQAGVPVIRGQNMSTRWVEGEFVYVSAEKANSLSANLARESDLIFTQRGTLGQVAIVPKSKHVEYLISQSQMKLTVDPTKADALFLYYLFRSQEQQDYIRNNAIQTGVPHTNLRILRETPLTIPPLRQQRAISAVLGVLDDKIELNRRTSETLEATARALFKCWFIDFYPVHVKAQGRRTKIPNDIAHLFPASLVKAEIGMVPSGWSVGRIDDDFDITMGQSPPGETYNETGDGLPFYQGRTDFGFRFPSRRVYCTAPTRFAKAGDTLVSVRAPVGSVNLAGEDCAIGRGVAAVRHKTGARSYTYLTMRSLEDVFARFEADGTVFGSIGKQDFHAISAVIPPRSLIERFEEIVSPIDDRIAAADKESAVLSSLRDTLLPKLISGELRIKDAERFVGAVA